MNFDAKRDFISEAMRLLFRWIIFLVFIVFTVKYSVVITNLMTLGDVKASPKGVKHSPAKVPKRQL